MTSTGGYHFYQYHLRELILDLLYKYNASYFYYLNDKYEAEGNDMVNHIRVNNPKIFNDFYKKALKLRKEKYEGLYTYEYIPSSRFSFDF